jgi:RimJ/RimL family protein N-acetyltransferase
MEESGEAILTLSDGTVRLRPWTVDDASFLAQATADPLIQRYNGTVDQMGFPAPPLTRSDAEAVIREFSTSWQAFAAGGKPGAGVAFAITDAASGQLAGCCGLDDWSDSNVVQFGYCVSPDTRGRGFATRAATLLTRWLFELGAERVVLKIVDDNDASVRVAQRAGFVHQSTSRSHSVWRGQRHDVRVFGAIASEWRPREQP